MPRAIFFYPANLFDIQPKEFLKARKLARPVTLSEFEVDPDEWTKYAMRSHGVRSLGRRYKTLLQHDYDYYDPELREIHNHRITTGRR